MNIKTRFFLVLLLFCSFFSAYAQRGAVKLDGEKLKAFQYQCASLIKYYEETLNFLGDSATLPKERQIVINDTYLKMFKDSEVQIEDDLISDRITVFYKDVRAYLRDVNFFYKNVTFAYHVQNTEPFYNERGALCFKVTANRTMKGTNIKGETHEDNMVRYIEIEYNDDKEDLKIVSIYTTLLDDTEDLANWWLTLPDFWRTFLSRETILEGGVRLSDVITFTDTTISFRMDIAYLNRIKNGEVFFKDTDGTDTAPYELVPPKKVVTKGKKQAPPPEPDTLITIFYPGKTLQPLVTKIIKQSDINLDDIKGVTDLTPLAKMTNLAYVSLNNTDIKDISTLRNLNKLESLKISNTQISDLSPIGFLINLKVIDLSGSAVTNISSLSDNLGLASVNISNTRIKDISPLTSLPALTELYMDSSLVKDLANLGKATGMKILTFNHTEIKDVSVLKNLTNLVQLEMNHTKITDLSPCSVLQKLYKISFENTTIQNMEALDQLPELKFIYCDGIKASQSDILNFINKNPQTLVVFNTSEMETWWNLLMPEWQEFFSGRVGFYKIPTRENLADIVGIEHIDIANRQTITDISCFNKLYMLKSLKASLSGIKSLVSLSKLSYLQKVDINYTGITDVSPLQSAPKLDTLLANNTKINHLSMLKNAPALRLIECDGTGINDTEVIELRTENPDCLVIYRTAKNTQWWKEINPTWQNIFFPSQGNPDKYQLQQILNTTTIDVTNNRSIADISPLKSFLYLKKLLLKGTSASDLTPISEHKTITYLDISNTPVNDIETLYGLQNLDTLSMANVPVKKFDIIEKLVNLRYLDISGTQIKNLKPVASLSKLEELSFSNTAVSSLDQLKYVPNLKKIQAYRTKISERSVTNFKKNNPDCEIIFY